MQHQGKCELVQEILCQNFKISEYIQGPDDAGAGALDSDDDNDEWNIQE